MNYFTYDVIASFFVVLAATMGFAALAINLWNSAKGIGKDRKKDIDIIHERVSVHRKRIEALEDRTESIETRMTSLEKTANMQLRGIMCLMSNEIDGENCDLDELKRTRNDINVYLIER